MILPKFLITLAVLAPLASQATPLYDVSLLPNVDFAPTGMNNAGHIVGFQGMSDGAIHAVLYAGGVLSDLGSLGGQDSYATAINDAGVITGAILTASGAEHAFVYLQGNVLDLGAGTAAYGINARGDVVGSKQTAGGQTGFVYRDGVLTELGNLGTGTQGSAIGINDVGIIAGDSAIDATNDGARHPYLYIDGALVDLGSPDGRIVSKTVAINNAGQVAGYSVGQDGAEEAFLYDRGVMHALGGLYADSLEIHDLNAHGALVGTAFAEDEGLLPFTSVDAALVDLNTLIDPALGWRIFSAYANNDLGQIVGYGCHGDTCGLVRLDLAAAIPEPGSAALLAAGLLAGLWRRAPWANGHG